MAVVDGLILRNVGPRQHVLAGFHSKTQLALLKFEHVDIQYIPRYALRPLIRHMAEWRGVCCSCVVVGMYAAVFLDQYECCAL